MTKGNKVLILLPVYKDSLSLIELVSLARCMEILGRHEICVVAPENLDLPSEVSSLRCERFNTHYFSGTEAYNSLMLSTGFYKRFLEYEYLLIHQLDVFIFKDTLLEWCSKSYSYVGAPWEQGSWWNEKDIRQGLPFWIRSRLFSFLPPLESQVGNGGLSLRKTKHMYYAAKLLKRTLKAWGGRNEDSFFSIAVPECWWWSAYSTPSAKQARNFSIEENPSDSVDLLNGELPLGCHAWDKHEPEFWHPIFENFGYSFDLEEIKKGSDAWQMNRKNKRNPVAIHDDN